MNSNQEEIQDLFDDQVNKDHGVLLADIKEAVRLDILKIPYDKRTEKQQFVLDRLNSEMHVSDNGQPDETKD